MSRKIHIVGNWKMNQDLSEINNFFTALTDLKGQDCETWIAPQFLHIPTVLDQANKLGFVKVGSQNCSHEKSGAYTGDISPLAIKEIGASFTLIGHSERRAFFKEGHEVLNKKTHLAIESGLDVIFCVGETLEEREAGKTEKVVREQLLEGLKNFSASNQEKLIIAYEPVWAIGTGKTASPDQAQEVHAYIRTLLNKELDLNGENIAILYGGSVKPGNVAELLSKQDIDGGLVGGASLKAEDFKALALNR